MQSFRTTFEPSFLEEYQRGVLNFQYRGIPCIKSPIDLAIYSRLLWDTKPGSIIEIGSNQGGSALWFADMMATYGIEANVVSVDLAPPSFREDSRIRFLPGDALNLAATLTERLMASLPRPLLVIEDSAHTYDTTLAALNFFAAHLNGGEFLIIEDGVVADLGLEAQYGGGPNRAISEFLEADPVFEIAEAYCNMFGPNATYNPNGYLRRL